MTINTVLYSETFRDSIDTINSKLLLIVLIEFITFFRQLIKPTDKSGDRLKTND